MAVKYYAQIEFDLISDPRFRQLSTNDVRFVYLSAHCSRFSNYIGLFHYPAAIWSHDANVKEIELYASISELEMAGLLEYNSEQQAVRLSDWFYSLNAPQNGNQMKGHIKSYLGLKNCPPDMLSRSVAEFTVSSFSQVLQWEELSSEHGKVREAFRGFLKTMYFRLGDDFSVILMEEINRSGKATFTSIQSCFHLLPNDGLLAVQPFRKSLGTVPQQKNTLEDHTLSKKEGNAVAAIGQPTGPAPSVEAFNSPLSRAARKVD